MEKIKILMIKNPLVLEILQFLLMLIIVYITYFITKKILMKPIIKLVRKSKNRWDDIFLERKVFDRFVIIVPLAILYVASSFFPRIEGILKRGSISLISIFILLGLNSIINSFGDIYNTFPFSKQRPIKGYLQTVKIILNLIGLVLIIALIINESPMIMFSGIGAMTAILLLIFKDTILSLVASIQLGSNNMLKIGDWITMPKFNADGDVVDIALHTVKVQNFDKSITYIPTHKFLDESFQNWRGMVESGGRRIKRAISIDLKTISFLSKEDIEELKQVDVLKDYFNDKSSDLLTESGSKRKISALNNSKLTNIGTFRAYLEYYLKNHPCVNHEMTFLVRQLAPNEKGLPIEIYLFTNDNRWVAYEAIQADIFDHILAIVEEFKLKVYQLPTSLS